MNVDGGSGNASFWNTGKTMMSIAFAVLDFFAVVWMSSAELSIASAIIVIIGLIAVNIFLIRKFIIEENYYLRMYEKQKQYEVAEPSIFWGVNIQNDKVLYFLDGKMGVIVKMERDTIVGKDEDFREKHYDAWSEFYKELNLHKLKRVQMNLMDTAGDDPRFKELDKLVIGAKFNSNLKELVERQIGHIKARARNTLFEDDYFLIYVENYIPYEDLMQSVHECLGKLMKGAFVGYRVLDRTALNELFKSEFDIKYFNEDNASISIYGGVAKNVVAFKIKSVNIHDEEFEVDTTKERALKELCKRIRLGKYEYGDIKTIKIVKPKQEDTTTKLDISIKEKEEVVEVDDSILENAFYDESLTEEVELEPIIEETEESPIKINIKKSYLKNKEKFNGEVKKDSKSKKVDEGNIKDNNKKAEVENEVPKSEKKVEEISQTQGKKDEKIDFPENDYIKTFINGNTDITFEDVDFEEEDDGGDNDIIDF